jgi:hypothetical protein
MEQWVAPRRYSRDLTEVEAVVWTPTGGGAVIGSARFLGDGSRFCPGLVRGSFGELLSRAFA